MSNSYGRIRAVIKAAKLIGLSLFGAFLVYSSPAVSGQGPSNDRQVATQQLGERLFKDDRFSAPQGDLATACSTCHLFDEDPQGIRAHADFFNRSWVPWRKEDPRRSEARNSPTILDAATMPRLHFDGEFGSMEELIRGTFAGRPMGWLPGEQPKALNRLCMVLLDDTTEGRRAAPSYRVLFKNAFGVELNRLTQSEIIDLVVRAVSGFLGTLRAERKTPYDAFVEINGLEASAAKTEDPRMFAVRLLKQVSALESNRTLKLPAGFDGLALRGMKLFFTVNGTPAGNCVTCHAPPLFTDLTFHNMGITQTAYDEVHGSGSFAALVIPDAAKAVRPLSQFREMPARAVPGRVDLGYWNFVDLKSSALRRAIESDDEFLRRMVATFKTPTLRNLDFTGPYMHTGDFPSLEDALTEILRMSEMARLGQVRAGDDELANIKLTESDIAPLVSFLRTLNEDLKKRVTSQPAPRVSRRQ
jgi:cytochrome c peroxidase